MENGKIKSLSAGHRDRVKEKFLKTDFSGWQDYEILEFALFFVIHQKDTKETAKKLLAKFGSLKELLHADYNELLKTFEDIKGAGRHTALFLYFLKSFSVKYSELQIKEKEYFSSPKELCIFLKNSLGTCQEEKMCAVFLNASGDVLGYKTISEGTFGKTAVYPGKIAKEALLLNARGVVVAHNHPGGMCKPSKNDIISTELIRKALDAIDVILLDHIIVTSSDYFSLKDNGLMNF